MVLRIYEEIVYRNGGERGGGRSLQLTAESFGEAKKDGNTEFTEGRTQRSQRKEGDGIG